MLSAPVVTHRLTSADLEGAGSRGALAFKITDAAVLKTVAAVTLGGMCFYYLHMGRTQRDPGHLFWAAVYGLASLLVFAL